MRKIRLLGFIILFSMSLSAQYKSFEIQKSNYSEVKIVQIDFREFSTLVHMRYDNNSKVGNLIYADENFYIKDNRTKKKYKLLNSFNLPLGNNNKYAVLEETNESINFTLEFEKIPDSSEDIDIIENNKGGGFNFYGVIINKQEKENKFIDIVSFIEETPIKEMRYYYKDGGVVEYYQDNGLTIAVTLSYDFNYGKYYRANILIQNRTGKDINFHPSNITAKIHAKSGIDTQVLTYAEYMKKVKKRQNWNSFAVAFSESMAATNAAYSSSTTHSSVSGYSNSFSSVYGYYGNTYGSAYGSTYSYGSAYGTSTTKKYDGAAAYAAQQNASNNIANYQNQQYHIKRTISEGYVKLNTIMNETEYVGYVNIRYKKTDRMVIYIPINGKTYLFLANMQ